MPSSEENTANMFEISVMFNWDINNEIHELENQFSDRIEKNRSAIQVATIDKLNEIEEKNLAVMHEVERLKLNCEEQFKILF